MVPWLTANHGVLYARVSLEDQLQRHRSSWLKKWLWSLWVLPRRAPKSWLAMWLGNLIWVWNPPLQLVHGDVFLIAFVRHSGISQTQETSIIFNRLVAFIFSLWGFGGRPNLQKASAIQNQYALAIPRMDRPKKWGWVKSLNFPHILRNQAAWEAVVAFRSRESWRSLLTQHLDVSKISGVRSGKKTQHTPWRILALKFGHIDLEVIWPPWWVTVIACSQEPHLVPLVTGEILACQQLSLGQSELWLLWLLWRDKCVSENSCLNHHGSATFPRFAEGDSCFNRGVCSGLTSFRCYSWTSHPCGSSPTSWSLRIVPRLEWNPANHGSVWWVWWDQKTWVERAWSQVLPPLGCGFVIMTWTCCLIELRNPGHPKTEVTWITYVCEVLPREPLNVVSTIN
jgi:hypothetical protein